MPEPATSSRNVASTCDDGRALYLSHRLVPHSLPAISKVNSQRFSICRKLLGSQFCPKLNSATEKPLRFSPPGGQCRA